MTSSVVITGIGMITPLGYDPAGVLERIRCGEKAIAIPSFDVSNFDCKVCATVPEFDAEQYFPDNKTLRLMNRDAQMAVVAARFAMEDAGVKSYREYPGEKIALFGSTGMASMAIEEIAQIIKHAISEDGSLNLELFGRVGLRRVRPVLSFRILANMPICFVSISENIMGPNAVYTPWQGHGAHALAAGIRIIERGEVPCALVGGCDVRTRELSFVSLQQLGIFASWKRYGTGTIPSEGAAFVVLENEEAAIARQRKPYAKIKAYKTKSVSNGMDIIDTLSWLLQQLTVNRNCLSVFGAGDGDVTWSDCEKDAIVRNGLESCTMLRPKLSVGDLFAASAPLQLGLAAQQACREESGQSIVVNCFGHGSEQSSFVLESM